MTRHFSSGGCRTVARTDASSESDPEPPRLRDILLTLRERLEEAEYVTVYRLHCYELAPRFLHESLAETLLLAPPRAQLLFRLLYFGETVSRSDTAAILGAEIVDGLIGASLLNELGGDRIACPYRLEIAGDTLLFTVALATRPQGIYFGEDSQFLRAVIRPRPGETCLDLCTGTGVQGLRCAQVARRVDLVDKHAPAVRLAQLNTTLNGLDDRVSVFQGDLWDALPDRRRYDYVVCNPPLMPVVETVPFPLYGHGGPDGLKVVRRILGDLPARLTDRGRCTLIGACTGEDGRPDVATAAAELLGDGFHVTLYLLLRTPLLDWVKLIAETAVLFAPGLNLQNAILRSRTAYAKLNKTVVYTYLLKARRADGPYVCDQVDYARVGHRSFWFVNRGMITQ